MSELGMSRTTGRRIEGLDDIRQSIATILTTPQGSRIERRDFGSLLPSLIDQPTNKATVLRLMAATVMAITKWEPRIKPKTISIALGDTAGSLTITLQANRIDGWRATRVNMDVPITLKTTGATA